MEKPPDRDYFTSTRRRLRFWFGGRLRDEVWLDASHGDHAELAEMTGAYHVRLAEAAEAVGQPWMVEVFDPAAPEATAYMRYGTDVERLASVPAARPHPDNSGPIPAVSQPIPNEHP